MATLEIFLLVEVERRCIGYPQLQPGPHISYQSFWLAALCASYAHMYVCMHVCMYVVYLLGNGALEQWRQVCMVWLMFCWWDRADAIVVATCFLVE